MDSLISISKVLNFGSRLIIEDNFEDFEEGIDYLSGVDETHDVVNKNLKYPQYRWDGRSLIYYIDPIDGQFIQKINQLHEYETNISSEGY